MAYLELRGLIVAVLQVASNLIISDTVLSVQ